MRKLSAAISCRVLRGCRYLMPSSKDFNGQSCRRCGELASIQGRNEPLCSNCFISYVRTKIVKRMEQFRVRNTQPGRPRTLLLPLSFGVSSLSLLAILDGHLSSQLERTGRTGFDLHVLHVQPPGDDPAREADMLGAVQRRMPRHMYSSTSLLDPYGPGKGMNDLVVTEDEAHAGKPAELPHDGSLYTRLLSSIPSVTSRTDILNILLTRTVTAYAQQHGCEGILWGDSTTRLAQKVLAETAKGRGFSLPWQIADGISPWGVAFYYPMRDLLTRELLHFSNFVDPPLIDLVQERAEGDVTPAASRNGSVDKLMKQFFESVEDQYPSIIANVVRTTAKLEKEWNGSSQCRFCKMSYVDEDQSLNGKHWKVNGSGPGRHNTRLCYGCASAIPEECLQYLPD